MVNVKEGLTGEGIVRRPDAEDEAGPDPSKSHYNEAGYRGGRKTNSFTEKFITSRFSLIFPSKKLSRKCKDPTIVGKDFAFADHELTGIAPQ